MPKVVVDANELCDVDEAAGLLNKGVATVWRWIRDNKLTVVKLGGRTLVPRSEVERLIKETDALE